MLVATWAREIYTATRGRLLQVNISMHGVRKSLVVDQKRLDPLSTRI